MIVVKLIGGLGNQLFQYALGRNLAIKNNTNLKLDITGFEKYKLRKYSLNHFNIVEDFASEKDIPKFLSKTGNARKIERLGNLIFSSVKYTSEESTSFNKNILSLRGSCYFEGYWQSEQYFKEISEVIKKEIIVKKPPTGKNLELANQIINCNSVCLHVRRGDYVNSPNTKAIYTHCDIEYYKKGLEIITKKNDNVVLFIFSDDPTWVKENMKFDFPTNYVDHNNADFNYEDLRLMSLCKHNIIANSSFSWWGAWLNENPFKQVVSPKIWINDLTINPNDINPPGWIVL